MNIERTWASPIKLCTMTGQCHSAIYTNPISCTSFHNKNKRQQRSNHIAYCSNESMVTKSYPDKAHKRKGIRASLVPVVFEPSKLQVSFMGLEEESSSNANRIELPRVYTLTHCDFTGKLAFTISPIVNQAQLQGWLRDEVIAEWKVDDSGICSLHVHCYICGGEWFLKATARLRSLIFRKDLPMVLEAFMHGDNKFFRRHPELKEAGVYVHFHSQDEEFNNVEFWGPLVEAAQCPDLSWF